MGLEVDTKDVEDLIAKNADEVMTDELVALQQEQQEEMSTEATEKEGKGEEVLSTSEIKQLLKQWEAVCAVILLHHPNKLVASL